VTAPEPLDLNALDALTAATPPGPWRAVGTEVYGPSPDCLWIADARDPDAEDGGQAVARLIAAARTALPELVTELREARREVERLRAELDTIQRSEDTELAITRAERDRYLDQLTDVIRERDDLAERVATLCQIAQEAADLAVDGREG